MTVSGCFGALADTGGSIQYLLVFAALYCSFVLLLADRLPESLGGVGEQVLFLFCPALRVRLASNQCVEGSHCCTMREAILVQG